MELSKHEAVTDAQLFYNKQYLHNRVLLYTDIFNWIDAVYLFTNENLPFILQNSNLNGKILTVTASLDHALNAILMGAKEIKMFDINSIAKYFAELKMQAVKKLSYEDFLKLYKIKPTFSGDLKLRLRNNINSQIVYDLCLDMEDSYACFFEKLLDLDFFESKKWYHYYKMVSNPNYNLYMNETYFYKLKELLEEVKIDDYIDCDMFDIKEYIGDEKYSTILFSNISSYFNEEGMKRFYILLNELENNLTDDGVIQIGYGNVKPRKIIKGTNLISRDFVCKYKDNIKEVQNKDNIVTYYHKK